MQKVCVLWLVSAVLSLPLVCVGGDWPTYRYDAARSACSPDALPALTQCVWSLTLPPFQPAFPNEPRQQFDRSYEPVCAAGTLVIGSPVDGSIRAFSTETGRQLWVHYADGPVRLAPVLHDGKVLVGADDGVFRCLSLTDGALLWSVAGYPAPRPDLRILGNNRLISMWPVRGGPVVVGDVVYFACGVWPTMGVYVHALRVADGTPVWSNERLSLLEHVRIDHNKLFDAGLSPQGYLLATAERLLLPNGRSQPVALNRADGSLFHFVQGYRNGDCRVALGGDYAFVGGRGVISLIDFREVGTKWVKAGDKAPDHFDPARLDQFEGPIHPYKHFAGCNASSVFDGSTAYSLAQGVFYAHDLAGAAVSEWETKQGSRALKPYRWDAPMRLRAPLGVRAPSRLFIKAGNRLYGHGGKWGVAIELTGDSAPANVVWEHTFAALPTSMIAADDRLFVTLQDGTVHCFAGSDSAVVSKPAAPARAPDPVSSPELAAVLDVTAARDGFWVVLGGMSTGEIDAVLAGGKIRLVVVDADAERVHRLRTTYGQGEHYGTRLEVFAGAAGTFELPPHLASVLWLRAGDVEISDVAQLARVWRWLRPYGGVLCVTGSARQLAGIQTLLGAATLQGAGAVDASAGRITVRRPDGPEGSADWTHETADAARSHYSRDTAVRAPLAPLWYGDGPDHGFFKNKDYGRGVKPQVAQGRVFALQQFSRTLFAYDAYTGRLLWTQRGAGAEAGFITRFVSRPDGIYAAGKGVCIVYDPASGRELRRLAYAQALPAGPGCRAAGIVVSDASVLIAGANVDTAAIEEGLWDADVLVCLDRGTGAIKWKRQAAERFNIKALAVASGRVFCTDSMSPLASAYWQRRGKGVTECVSTVLALDEADGSVQWQYEFRTPYRQHGASGWLSVRGTDDWLACVEATGRVIAGRHQTAALLDAADGRVIWDKPLGLTQPLVIMGEELVDQSGRLIHIERAEVSRTGLFARGGCNYAVANQHLLVLRDQTVCYVDIASGQRHRLRNMRSGCSNSTIPACGLLNIPNFSVGCVCNYPVQTSSAWIHMPGIETWGGTEPVTVKPVRMDTGIPTVSAEVAAEMHAFKRRFLVSKPDDAAEYLIARWTFDAPEPDRPEFVRDESVNQADCIVSNPVFESRGSGRALVCGSDTAKTCGTARLPSADSMRDAATLCAWVKLGEKQHKGATGIVECPQFYRLMVDNTDPPYAVSFSLQTDTRSWRGVRTPQVLKPGAWMHVAGTFDGETGESIMYLNGEEVGRSGGMPCRIGSAGSQIAIGVRDGGAYLNGAVDDVRMYNRTLGPDVIAALANE